MTFATDEEEVHAVGHVRGCPAIVCPNRGPLTLSVSQGAREKQGRKWIRKWHFVVMGAGLFVVGIIILGERFTLGVVAARILDALGDVVLDRGVAEDL